MRTLLETWTEYYWGYFLRALFLGKIRPSAKLWKKIMENRSKAEGAEDKHIESEAGMSALSKAAASVAKPLRSCFFCFAFYLVVIDFTSGWLMLNHLLPHLLEIRYSRILHLRRLRLLRPLLQATHCVTTCLISLRKLVEPRARCLRPLV